MTSERSKKINQKGHSSLYSCLNEVINMVEGKFEVSEIHSTKHI